MLKPLADRVIVKLVEMEEKTKSGLVLPTSAQQKSEIAEVVAVGPGTHDVAMTLNLGDKVICSKYAGTEIKYEGEEYIIIKESDILAKVL